MQEFDFSIENLKGIDNRVADALSRHPIPPEPQSICSLRVSGYSPQEIALWQQGDASIKEQVLRLQELAPAKAKTPADNHFRLCKGVLYRTNSSTNGKKYQLVVPSILRRDILQSCHASTTSGHFGVQKTQAKVSERFWWPNMSADVRAFVASCYFCQTHKHPTGLIEGKLQPIAIPAKPFSLMGIDHIGPIRRTARGNKHILVAVDYFSKWIIANPCPISSIKK